MNIKDEVVIHSLRWAGVAQVLRIRLNSVFKAFIYPGNPKVGICTISVEKLTSRLLLWTISVEDPNNPPFWGHRHSLERNGAI
jgi:hypothetical protein